MCIPKPFYKKDTEIKWNIIVPQLIHLEEYQCRLLHLVQAEVAHRPLAPSLFLSISQSAPVLSNFIFSPTKVISMILF